MAFEKGTYIRYLLVLGLLIVSTCSVVQAWEDDDLLHWTDDKSSTLEWGETIENGNYTVEAYDFPRTNIKGQIGTPYVGIHLYENDVLVLTESLLEWESFIYDGEVRVTVDAIMPDSDIHWQNDTYEPWADITIELRGLPDLDIVVETIDDDGDDIDTFKLTDYRIPVTINIENEGDAPLEDVDLYIDTGGLEFDQFTPDKDTHYTYDIIEDGTSIPEISFELKIPSHMKDTEYNIRVNVTGIDEKDEPHNFIDGKEITVLNMVNITKNTKSDIFMTDTAFIQLTIRNDGTYAVNNIELEDNVGDYFELVGSSPLQWNLNLGPGEFKDYRYTVKPVKPDPDGYELPEAEARWEVDGIEYSQTCVAPEIIVHGSKILLEKTVSPTKVAVNGDVTVTVTATNVGDVKASVEIFDDSPLPDNVTLVSGEMYTKEVIDEEDSVSISYVLRADIDGIYELPQSTAKFFDLQGYRSEEISSAPEFTAGDPPLPGRARPGYTPTPTSTPIETPTREEPGFGILFGLVGLASAVLLALRK